MFVVEMIIYIKLYYSLWKHDEGMKDKISSDDLNQRKRKNISSLSGQVISFFIEFITSLIILANILNKDLILPSAAPIGNITSKTIISISLLCTSHELRRYIWFKIKDHNFNMF